MSRCKHKQQHAKLALWAGQELDRASAKELQQIIESCSDCCEHWQQLNACLELLHRCGSTLNSEEATLHDSVWPAVSARISNRGSSMRRGRFNGWIPASAIAAACALIFVFSDTSDSVSHSVAQPGSDNSGDVMVVDEFGRVYRDESWLQLSDEESRMPLSRRRPATQTVGNVIPGGF